MDFMDYNSDEHLYLFSKEQGQQMESYTTLFLQNLITNFDNVVQQEKPIIEPIDTIPTQPTPEQPEPQSNQFPFWIVLFIGLGVLGVAFGAAKGQN